MARRHGSGENGAIRRDHGTSISLPSGEDSSLIMKATFSLSSSPSCATCNRAHEALKPIELAKRETALTRLGDLRRLYKRSSMAPILTPTRWSTSTYIRSHPEQGDEQSRGRDQRGRFKAGVHFNAGFILDVADRRGASRVEWRIDPNNAIQVIPKPAIRPLDRELPALPYGLGAISGATSTFGGDPWAGCKRASLARPPRRR